METCVNSRRSKTNQSERSLIPAVAINHLLVVHVAMMETGLL
jgi:hypothetical protein